MSTPNDGGPAFPWHQSPGNQNNLGMSLRDWFAGKIAQGLAANTEWTGAFVIPEKSATPEYYLMSVARISYATADAMLAEREKKQ